MDRRKFSLNPDAKPFTPSLKKSTAVLEPRGNPQKSEIRLNRVPGHANMDSEQQRWETSISYLRTLFPDISEGSVMDVYLACEEDVYEAERMLRMLEGLDSGSENSEGRPSLEASPSKPSNEGDSSGSTKKP